MFYVLSVSVVERFDAGEGRIDIVHPGGFVRIEEQNFVGID